MSHYKSDVFISGAGIPGLSLALLLAEQEISVTIAEPMPPEPLKKTKRNGRTSALLEGSLNVIKATGVWDQVSDFTEALNTMRIVDKTLDKKETHEHSIDFEAEEIGKESFGRNVPNDVLRAALFEKAKKTRGIKILKKNALQSIETTETGVLATLNNDKQIRAQIIIGADGKNSVTRQCAGIDADQKPYGQSAMTFLITHTNPHNQTSVESHREGGPFTVVPLPDDKDGKHTSSVVWVEKTYDTDKLISQDQDEFEAALQTQTPAYLGSIKIKSKPEAWPLIYSQSKSLIGNKVALIAEAAHAIHPLGAQGLNLSLRDVAILAELLVDAKRTGGDLGAPHLLKQYERRRRFDISSRVFAVNNLNLFITRQSSLVHRIRRFGLKALDFVPVVKQEIMGHGLRGPQVKSRLLDGQSL